MLSFECFLPFSWCSSIATRRSLHSRGPPLDAERAQEGGGKREGGIWQEHPEDASHAAANKRATDHPGALGVLLFLPREHHNCKRDGGALAVALPGHAPEEVHIREGMLVLVDGAAAAHAKIHPRHQAYACIACTFYDAHAPADEPPSPIELPTAMPPYPTVPPPAPPTHLASAT